MYISLENPSTGQKHTIDAKVDTGAAVTVSDEDTIDTPIYVCDSESGVALLGMDVLRLCNYAQWHEWSDDEHSVYFQMELISEELMLLV